LLDALAIDPLSEPRPSGSGFFGCGGRAASLVSREMKSENVSSVLVLLLFIGALGAVWLSVRWFFSMREMQALQAQQVHVNNTRAAAQALANDTIRYADRNPALEPLLAEFNLRPVTNQPPTKPTGK